MPGHCVNPATDAPSFNAGIEAAFGDFEYLVLNVESIRCGSCSALLFRAGNNAIKGVIEIKCRRCGTINSIKPIEVKDLIAPDIRLKEQQGKLNEN